MHSIHICNHCISMGRWETEMGDTPGAYRTVNLMYAQKGSRDPFLHTEDDDD